VGVRVQWGRSRTALVTKELACKRS
jgi:hypothetical protein